MPRHRSFLQGEILFVIFGKVQRLCLKGKPLAGGVFEPVTFPLCAAQSLLRAENHTIFYLRAILAIRAGAIDFFSKQHGSILLTVVVLLYTSFSWKATIFSGFHKSKGEQ